MKTFIQKYAINLLNVRLHNANQMQMRKFRKSAALILSSPYIYLEYLCIFILTWFVMTISVIHSFRSVDHWMENKGSKLGYDCSKISYRIPTFTTFSRWSYNKRRYVLEPFLWFYIIIITSLIINVNNEFMNVLTKSY